MMIPPPLHTIPVVRPVPARYTQKVEADPTIPPNQTLYINNLNDRVNVKVLKAALREMFGRFGKIIDIVALTSFWRKGQAFVVFDTVEAAQNAMNHMQGFMFHGHAMRINFAREKSDAVAKAEGTFQPRPEGPKKPRAIKEREATQLKIFEKLQSDYLAGTLEGMTQPGDPKLIQALQAAQARMNNMTRTKAAGAEVRGDVMHHYSTTVGARGLPNRILFVEGLPEGVGVSDVNAIFASSLGFLEARVIASRRVAFIDFDNEFNAGYAMQAVQGHVIGDSSLRISYAKR
ncbi:U1 small nuclear ribonucleoprotein A [Babesia sp. Xinjiang]|uniref:U1 small nuclear ribonucleoprotein A n=1 Tax=Babesia sp. Xinjiang TaxID=462227 RepID=UPI000A220290|nr:U1 small nuclear ribonucleoprotein A [Babesia sp. Xinjiang]ORM42366.1 U1 small nuclear ribonucleoprotein A [Babesia sp. Xinjiang]